MTSTAIAHSLYRIHVEDVPGMRATVAELVSAPFAGFTVTYTLGYWEGQPESSMAIDIYTDDGPRVDALAEQLRVALQQDAVLVARFDVSARLIQREAA